MSDPADISGNLWSKTLEVPLSEVDRQIILEQYKLYVASAEKISQNRLAAGTFFLSFNTAITGALAGFFEEIKDTDLIGAFYVATIAMCLAWMLILRSYRNINSAKFKVIGAIEQRLPMSPYWSAEWAALGRGNDYRVYIPLSVIEQIAPFVFVSIYAYLLALL